MEAYRDGVWLAELAPLADPALLAPARPIAEELCSRASRRP
jgi:predicted ATPase